MQAWWRTVGWTPASIVQLARLAFVLVHSCQAKVGDLEVTCVHQNARCQFTVRLAFRSRSQADLPLTAAVNEHILGLDVAMADPQGGHVFLQRGQSVSQARGSREGGLKGHTRPAMSWLRYRWATFSGTPTSGAASGTDGRERDITRKGM